MNKEEIIKHYESNLLKCINSHKAVSDFSLYAFFQFQAARNGMSVQELNEFAKHNCIEVAEQASKQISLNMSTNVDDAYDEVIDHIGIIKKYEADFLACVNQDTVFSDKTSLAFFKMQGAKLCMNTNAINEYAEAQLSKLKAVTA